MTKIETLSDLEKYLKSNDLTLQIWCDAGSDWVAIARSRKDHAIRVSSKGSSFVGVIAKIVFEIETRV